MSSEIQTDRPAVTLANRYLGAMDMISQAIWIVSLTLFLLLTLLTVGTVATRQFLDFVPAWTGEIQRYLAIWMTLLLVGPLIYEDNHLSIRLLSDRLPSQAICVVRYIELGLVLVLGIVLINWGTEYMLDSGAASTSPTLNLQMMWVYLIIPITGWLIVLFTAARLTRIRLNGEALAKGYSSPEEHLRDQGEN